MDQLLSVNVGLPRDVVWEGRTVRTAIWKESVRGRCMARRLNLDGDGQGDLLGHGGEQRAVFVYPIESYRYWEKTLGRSDFVHGQFGENFTVEGLTDDVVCVGDRYRIGGALFEVTQPRVTCYRVGIRMREPRMPALLVSHGRPGFYLRVLEEGEVGAGDAIERVARGPEGMTVAEANALLYKPGHPREALERALRIPALSPGWRGSFQALLDAQARGAFTGNPALASAHAPATPGFRTLRVAAVVRESASVTSFAFESDGPGPLEPAQPGQHIVLRLAGERGAPPLLRSYSLSLPSSPSRYRISVKREPQGAGSRRLHDQVRVGDRIAVSAPRGAFTLSDAAPAVVLISAGVGATPVLAMLHALAGRPSPPRVWWLYGARNAAEHPFAREARDLVARIPGARTFVVYSRPSAEDRPGVDFDATGHLAPPLLERLGVPRGADFYLCGPAGFLNELAAGLAAWGAAPDRVHSEVFGPGAALTPGVVGGQSARAPHPPAGPAGTGPEVAFARSGLTVRWDGRRTLLELAEACDVPVRWSCRTGVCHNCETGLVAGHVAYAPEPIEPPAAGCALICCSRPTDDVTLDL